MKHIHILKNNNTLITFNKGGSTLISSTLKIFCDWKGMKVRDELGSGRLVIITRNPINRFYSGFLHHTRYTNEELDVYGINKNWESKPDDFIVYKLQKYFDFLKYGEEYEAVNDFHLVRQSTILNTLQLEEGREIFYHKIEDINDYIQLASEIEKASSNLNYYDQSSMINGKVVMGYLPFLEQMGFELDGWDSHFFIGNYYLMQRVLDGGHHRGLSDVIRVKLETYHPQLANDIKDWLKEDKIRFGYDI